CPPGGTTPAHYGRIGAGPASTPDRAAPTVIGLDQWHARWRQAARRFGRSGGPAAARIVP
ncbi:hypothetical protein, partial [Streptomyces hirsutus]|uniref:hypothetical protein n=1 Tax=Streptomyces hirsutus TaxID=35620 RepID=UPI001B809432